VIHFGAIGYVLGQFLLIFAAAMGVPLLYGAIAGENGGALHVIYAAAATVAAGGALLMLPRPRRELSQREGLLLTVATWLAFCFFGCLPFYLSPHYASFTDAYFEAASGFTTTGSTVLADVEVLPPVIQFWRCFTHWLGGLGIVLLGVAVLPLVGHGGMHLYRAEFSGARNGVGVVEDLLLDDGRPLRAVAIRGDERFRRLVPYVLGLGHRRLFDSHGQRGGV
jgi:trk system potassium uptake protein TrkH